MSFNIKKVNKLCCIYEHGIQHCSSKKWINYKNKINYNYRFSQFAKWKKVSEDYVECNCIFIKIKDKQPHTIVKKYECKIFLDFILFSFIASLLIHIIQLMCITVVQIFSKCLVIIELMILFFVHVSHNI